jgi:DNA-binding ferritin-like protein
METIVTTLKESYSRDIRKQLVKATLASEKNDNKESLALQYNLLNQIFSYVLKECNWQMPTNSKEWDNKPLEIMKETFPKLEQTKWYQDQASIRAQNIDVVVGEK